MSRFFDKVFRRWLLPRIPLAGRTHTLVITWPEGKSPTSLIFDDEELVSLKNVKLKVTFIPGEEGYRAAHLLQQLFGVEVRPHGQE